VLYPVQYQQKLRSQSPEIRPGEDGKGNFIVRTPGRPYVKRGEKPRGIVFCDDSFFVFYEKWSIKEDQLLSYKYHYQKSGAEYWSMRYDMEEWEKPGHPKHHLQISVLDELLDKALRLPTGEVRCEEVIEAISQQLVH